jgi:hypothetical protein
MLRHHLSHGPVLGPPADHFHGVQHLQSFPRALAIGPIGPIGCSNLFRAKQFSIRNQENDLCVPSGNETWIAGKSTYKIGDVLLKPPCAMDFPATFDYQKVFIRVKILFRYTP